MAMRDLLYFNPDPDVEDSDLLGIGDLIYSDGSTQYIPGNDPELIAGLPPIPPGMSPGGAVGMGPPEASAPSAQPMGPPQMPPPIELETDQGPMQLDMAGNIQPLGLGEPAQPERRFSNLMGGFPSADPMTPGAPPSDPTGASLAPAEPPPAAPPPVTIQSPQGPMTIDPTGNISPGAGGVPFEQLQQEMGGMIPVQREGALPPDVAQRQMAEMGAMNAQTLAATEQARRDETRIYGELVLKQMAANEAERLKREQEVADNQARSERLMAEVQRVNETGLDRTVNGAMGDFSGTLGIVGAMLMGAAGNPEGFRMLERQVDKHLNEQMSRKDTTLRMLANELGSTQQAIAAGKAAIYKVTADKMELLAQKTKSDVYEAQTPAVLQQLRQKQMEQMQEFERQSLGKTLEKAPLPPKPPDPAMLKAYGEVRRSRDSATNMVERVEQQVGLLWEPGRDGRPGRYQNRDEIKKRGMEGIGSVEQWVPDAFYSTLGMQEGVQLRGAAEALAYAQIRQMQPTGPISNADIQAAVKAGALQTEEGMIRGLERMRLGEEEQMRNDAAQYTPDVVNTYEQQWRRSGGQPARAPAPSRPATFQDVRREMPGNVPQAANPVSTDDPQERAGMLAESLTGLAQEKGLGPEAVQILMGQARHETNGFKNMPANNAWGMKSTARNRARGAGSANLETTEGAGSEARRVRQDFATFATPADAAADMLSLLERKYPLAVEALAAGDVAAYVDALHSGGFFTANPDIYLKGVLRNM